MRTLVFVMFVIGLVINRLLGRSEPNTPAIIYYSASVLFTHWAMCKGWKFFMAKPMADYANRTKPEEPK